MFRLAKALILVLVIFLPAYSEAQINTIQSQLESMGLSAYTNEWVSMTGASAVLTAAKVTDLNVQFVTIYALGGNIIWTRTGQTPTTTYGNILLVGGVILLSQPEAALWKGISQDTTKTVYALTEYYAPQGTASIP